jgi:hypothetical protein
MRSLERAVLWFFLFLGIAAMVFIGRLSTRSAGSADDKPSSRLSDETAAVCASNEVEIICRLHELVALEERVRAQNLLDRDGDGVGEYAFFGELLAIPELSETSLRTWCGSRDESGTVLWSGYRVKIYLPAHPSEKGYCFGLAERDGMELLLDTDIVAGLWFAYAWPEEIGVTGMRTFHAMPSGVSYAKADYSGSNEPVFNARCAEPFFGMCSSIVTLYDENFGIAIPSVDDNVWFAIEE